VGHRDLDHVYALRCVDIHIVRYRRTFNGVEG
jgi:hypothetical protein